MSTSCKNVQELIPLFPADLEPGEAGLVGEHAASCTMCAGLLASYAAQAGRFAAAREARPRVDLWDGIQKKLAEPRRRESGIIVFGWGRAAAAAAVLLALGAAFALRERPVPAPEPIAHTPVVAPKTEAPKDARPRVRPYFFGGEGAIPVHGGGRRPWQGLPVGPRGEVEIVPFEQEAEVPASGRRFKQSDAVPVPRGARTAEPDEDRSVSF